ncbi:CesT family type III secretion system chaperone [Endozoicomonas sp. SCSIO W0465]|uniref:CesT family type III secretion system chaperone n=1 Tax=Endozoicomonas sp. SCSIO W0465 TaxID=2918516 RepID=UPI0020757548|nr:CesT family type III secretion system chaperone [Endozoicomonas sp. SCSIO W0465]USE39025.1 CesT family type III secretion system chaperone [Endozoicomonas sp. SCSIO W0465]
MSFEKLMNSYAARQQMGALEYENDRYALVVDDRLEVACFQAHGRFYVYSIISKLPEDNGKRQDLLMGLLEKNLALVAAERVSLCIDPDENALAVYVSAPIRSLSVDVIEEAIVALANNHALFVKWVGQSAPSPGSAMMFLP